MLRQLKSFEEMAGKTVNCVHIDDFREDLYVVFADESYIMIRARGGDDDATLGVESPCPRWDSANMVDAGICTIEEAKAAEIEWDERYREHVRTTDLDTLARLKAKYGEE